MLKTNNRYYTQLTHSALFLETNKRVVFMLWFHIFLGPSYSSTRELLYFIFTLRAMSATEFKGTIGRPWQESKP